jgi:hypothetical protein
MDGGCTYAWARSCVTHGALTHALTRLPYVTLRCTCRDANGLLDGHWHLRWRKSAHQTYMTLQRCFAS